MYNVWILSYTGQILCFILMDKKVKYRFILMDKKVKYHISRPKHVSLGDCDSFDLDRNLCHI